MAITESMLQIDNVVFTQPKHLLVCDAFERLEKIQHRTPGAIDDLWTWDPDNKKAVKYADYYEKCRPEDLIEHEWGIAIDETEMNPECVLVSGGDRGVSWGTFLEAKLVPFAHSHPFSKGRSVAVKNVPVSITTGGVLWDDINGKNPNQKTNLRLLIFPSAQDAIFCREQNVKEHWVETPYLAQNLNAHYTYIVNPPQDPTALDYKRLRFRISNPIIKGDVPKKANYDRNSSFVHTEIDLTAFEGRVKFWGPERIKVTQIGSGGLDI